VLCAGAWFFTPGTFSVQLDTPVLAKTVFVVVVLAEMELLQVVWLQYEVVALAAVKW
jgi:hypothetical protein